VHQQVSGVPSGTFTAVCSGLFHSVAIRSDRTVVAWGLNDHGQCDVPATLGRCKQVVAGRHFSLALTLLPCVGDTNGDGRHSGLDIAALFAVYGTSDPMCDLDGNGIVDSIDFTMLLAAWGSCPDE